MRQGCFHFVVKVKIVACHADFAPCSSGDVQELSVVLMNVSLIVDSDRILRIDSGENAQEYSRVTYRASHRSGGVL